MNLIIHPPEKLRGTVRMPGDKSISHRAAIFAALAEGTSTIYNFLPGGDCQATLACLRALGVAIEEPAPATVKIEGVGLRGLQEPAVCLDCANSGTSMRLLAGVLAGQPFMSILDGSEQLRRRPMGRITQPLQQMAATVLGRQNATLAPLAFRGGGLHQIDYTMPVASAQVKSAILLAGLFADGLTVVREPGPARDHTERLLRVMGGPVHVYGSVISIERPRTALTSVEMTVPGDISSAAFLIAAALITPGAQITVAGVGVNPRRTGILEIFREMGADLEISNERQDHGEPVADVTARHGQLRGIEIGGDLIVRAIDELPIVAVAATQAHGRTLIRDAAELRIKETDRIATIVSQLRRLGATIEEQPDGFIVDGPTQLGGAPVHSHGDHRLAMALAVAGLVASGPVLVEDAGCIADSYPGFERALTKLGVEVEVHS
ncbi:MAG: 3-phosphoshikimate 1-carboxyvinyltransferase [Chloroflexota bacterium]|nr:3-phosphoshikimate 1-carboxyvinyltransferase [Chloroflexota bacterium]